ncbi:MAG TPA: 2-oxoacid:acceptor oxidoreductase subunit alpha [bacterium]|nr:2-oxoacid:acceptor oxidoreductase subunit alpha [bacterium]
MFYSIKIVGPAGFGIKVTGLILSKYFLRSGYHVFTYTEYPSLIRGGHNTFQVDLACQIHPERVPKGHAEGSHETLGGVNSASEKCDILIALNEEALNKELNNLNNDATIICDEKVELDPVRQLADFREDKIVKAPLMDIAKNAGGELMKNTVALGVLLGILDRPIEILNEILEETFGHKGEALEKNKQVLVGGYEWVRENRVNSLSVYLNKEPEKKNVNLLMTGNHACALGAIAAGCQFYSAYPMTPATEILHFLKAKQHETNLEVHQSEDEIAAIHAAIGASFAGARSATGTSGGGFALMAEGLSLAGQVELPLVIFEVMRPGPATGLPTWTEQGDLKFIIDAGHGEFPRLVLAPGTAGEAFELTKKAFDLADKYQIPAFIVSDKFLGESFYTVPENIFDNYEPINRGKIILETEKLSNKEIEGEYQRYKTENDGVSWRTIPGVDGGEYMCTSMEHHENGLRCGEYVCNSDEHDETGLSSELSDVRKRMVEKRMKKLTELKKEITLPTLYGEADADITLVCWGSMLGPCLDALKVCHPESREYGTKDPVAPGKINVLHFSHIYPLPLGLKEYLNKFKKLVLVENNFQGQLGQLICQETGIEIKAKLLKYDGRPFWKEEILRGISNV